MAIRAEPAIGEYHVAVTTPACVGRDRELAQLSRPADGARVVAILGPPGIGKTALLHRTAARHPGPVWRADAATWESAIPGAVLRQLLQAPVPDAIPAAAEEVAARLTTAGTLVIVDDADHADAFSLQALGTLTRRHRDLAVTILLAATTSTPLLAELADDELVLDALDTAAVTELAGSHGRILHPAMAAALTRHTRGNPRDVLALITELPASVWAQANSPLPAPAHVIEDVRARLHRCGPAGRELVQALAILGDDESLGAAAELAGLADPLAAVDDAAAAGLLAASPQYQLRLRDPLTRAAVIAIIGFDVAAQIHRHAAAILTDPARRLRHLVAATPIPDAELAEQVERLAHQRGAEGAWAQAATLFRDASRLTADPLLHDDRLTRSVDALVAAGDCVGAGAMVPAVESLRETPLRDAVLAYLAVVRGRGAEAQVRLDRAWDIVNTERDPATAALIAQRYVLHSLMRCRGAELVTWADRAIELAGDRSPAGVEAAAIRGLGLAATGGAREAIAGYDDLAARVRHGAQAQRVTMGRGWLQLATDDFDGARSSLESAVAMAELGGSTRITLWALGWLARVQFAIGDWDRALHSVDRGRALAAASGIVLVGPLLEWTAAQIHTLRGDRAATAAAVTAADAVGGDYELMRLPALLARAQVAEADSDHPTVQRVLEPLSRMPWDTALHQPGLWPWADVLATALVANGRLEVAETVLDTHEEAARGHRSATARLRSARGRLLGARGDLPGAIRSFDEAIALLDGLPLRYDLARVNFAYGQTLRRAGKRRDADTVINAARELYLSVGARSFVERCERELKAGGVHQIRGPRSNVELTPQEDAVTSLVVQGLSNRDVAAELYISPKTVQYHLTRVYAKLGVRSRTELAALRH